MNGISKAMLSDLRISPRKVRLCVDLIRGMRAEEAMLQLQFLKKHAARPIATLLQSAMANATHNHGLDPKSLVVSEAYVNGGPTMYRWMPRAQGRATPIRKRTSHITIVLSGVVLAGGTTKKSTKAKNESETEETVEEATTSVKPAKEHRREPKKVGSKVSQGAAPRKTTVRKAGRKK